MEGSGQLKVPGALSPVKQPQVPIEYETGWAAALVWSISKKEKSLEPSTGNGAL